jgi:ribosomal protein S18 acetylase RimI-like enzyme
MDIIYRNYEERDFNDLLDMVLCLKDEDPTEIPVPVTEKNVRDTVSESIAHPDKLRVIMILADGQVAGYCIIVFYWNNEYGGNAVNIDEMYIREQYRNKNIATNFIKHQMAAHEKAVTLNLETTKTNAAAERFYKRLGFSISSNNHWVMSLQ